MKCTGVTITGADDSTDIGQLVEWSKRFPFVEWGILVSASREGSARFPSRPWISAFATAVGENMLQASTHLCGRWVRSLLIGELNWNEVPVIARVAQRVQINTHAVIHAVSAEMFRNLDLLGRKQFIFQADGVNANHAPACIGKGIDAAILFDTSGGAGEVPGSWPAQHESVPCGYAGGLGPHNVVQQLAKIEAATTRPYWIDMERRVRVEDDSRLDDVAVVSVLEQVERLMRAADGAVG